MSLGHNLKELRQKQSLNQKDLSDRSGVSQATISRIETGRVRQPGSSALKNLADALGVSTDSLMDDKARLARVHKDRLHQIAETLNAFVVHENGLLLFISQTLADSLGYRGEELLAKDSIELLFAPQSRPTARHMVASGSSNAYEALMVRSDDSFLPVEITNVNISKKARLVIARDITARCCQQGTFRVLQAGCEAERVRDLGKVVRILRDELEAMGVQFEAVSLQVIDEQRNLLACYRAYSAARGYRSIQNVVNLQDSLGHFASLRILVSYWNRDKDWKREADEDFRQMSQEIFSDSTYRPGLLIDVPFAQGMLGLGLLMGGPSHSEQLPTILREFARSISLVVKRLFELQSLRERLDQRQN
ncbi:MAG: helix-turn-helix domain-containing protein [Gemmatimonadetes bacterium]|nr:helix-turn-helix domain-containing protein [Gemmatimonadota bacterium]MDE2735135.1 helix-turn-helix domain-containing protein [Gemmatimonadota bacterium]